MDHSTIYMEENLTYVSNIVINFSFYDNPNVLNVSYLFIQSFVYVTNGYVDG
jgi:hypothetical protein